MPQTRQYQLETQPQQQEPQGLEDQIQNHILQQLAQQNQDRLHQEQKALQLQQLQQQMGIYPGSLERPHDKFQSPQLPAIQHQQPDTADLSSFLRDVSSS